MIVTNLNVENEKIHLSNLSLSFCETGIYLITGENGSGKTSIIKEIINGNCKIEFTEPKQNIRYQENKASLLAYVPQNIDSPEISIIDYLRLGNPKISEEDLLQYRHFFSEDIHTKFTNLSGGEKMKCAIVSALLKDTPYIILDEPTNHMDNQSVKQLNELIQSFSNQRTFIICSHDPRFNLDQSHEYHISNQKVEEIVYKSNPINSYLGKKIKFNSKRITQLLLNPILFACIFVIILSTLFAILYRSELDLMKNLNTESLPINNMICTYQVGSSIDDLNLQFAKYQNIQLDNSLYTRQMMVDDIPVIANQKGINQILITDLAYYQKISEEANNDIYCVSLPEMISDHFLEQVNYGYDLNTLEEGRLPLDDQNEIVVSKELLHRDYPEVDVYNSLGQTIQFNQETYTIVGISYVNYYVISYSSLHENNGFYVYEPSTFEQFKQDESKYYREIGWEDIPVESAFISVEDEYEKEVVAQLITTYPAQLFYSNYFAQVIKEGNNRNVVLSIIQSNVPYLLFTIVSLGLIFYLNLRLNSPIIHLLSRYYLEEKKIIQRYISIQLIDVLIPLLAALFFIPIVSSYRKIQILITLLYALIYLLFTIVHHVLIYKALS